MPLWSAIIFILYMPTCDFFQKSYNALVSGRNEFASIFRDRSKRENALRLKETLRDAAAELIAHFRKVDFSKLKPGMKMLIKQPGGVVYQTSAAADDGLGGFDIREHWIETEIVEVNMDPENLFIRTKNFVLTGSFVIDEFSPENLWYEKGVLHAELN